MVLPKTIKQISSRKVACVCAAAFILCAVIYSIWAYKTGDEREQRRALRRLDKDASEVLGAGLSDGGLKKLVNDLVYGQIHADYRLDISGIPEIPYTVGTDGSLDRDAHKKQMSAHADLSVMNYHVHHADIYVQGQQAYICMQDEENGDYTIDFNNISGVINSSGKMQEIGVRIPKGFMINLFPERDNMAVKPGSGDAAGEYPDNAPLLSGDDTDIIIETDDKHDIRSIRGTVASGSTYQIILDGENIPIEHLTLTADNIPAKYLFNTEEIGDIDLYASFSPRYDAASDTLEIICDRMVLSASGEDIFRMRGSINISRQAGVIEVLKPEKTGDIADLIADIHYEMKNRR